ncbi:AAA family ATPase [Corynebacterium ulcerans]|nr:AAA family ATPase [Corynebacterium ulcerans]
MKATMTNAEVNESMRTSIARVIIKNYRRFEKLDINFDSRINILVGSNEAGKTSLLEAINLTLTGRINGRWAPEALNPYWFNLQTTTDYFDSYDASNPQLPPEISIEVFLASNDPDVLRLQGENNSLREEACGLKIQISLDPDFATEFSHYMSRKNAPQLLPTEFFSLRWSGFNSEDRLNRRPKGIRLAQVDSRIQRSQYGVDYFTRQLLVNHISPSDSANLSASIRIESNELTERYLKDINEKLKQQPGETPEALGVQLDQASTNSWHNSIVPQVDSVPFAMAGQAQQATAKIELAMLRSTESTDIVLIEEPENHLSHTRLRKLVDRLCELAKGRQLILTTHSSFVLNRLGLDNLRLLDDGKSSGIGELDSLDSRFFQKLPNFDTLRLVLADKVALVEGPSDQMILDRAIKEKTGMSSEKHGIDIISVDGTKFKRWLELAKLLRKPTVALRDSDGESEEYWRGEYAKSLGDNGQLFVGDPTLGRTLEPQLVTANRENQDKIKEKLGINLSLDLETWMTENKTEAALRLVELPEGEFVYPDYILRAVKAFQR